MLWATEALMWLLENSLLHLERSTCKDMGD